MAMNASSYRGPTRGGRNSLLQYLALSGRTTLADLPALYGAAAGLAGGGQEQDSSMMGGGLEGAPPLSAGAGPGSSGGIGFQGGLPSGGELPVYAADPNGPSPSAYNPGFPSYRGGGEGGTQADPRLGASADLSLGNVASGLGFGLGMMSGMGALQTGLQGMGHLAFPEDISSPVPGFTGEFNARDYLSPEVLAAIDAEQNPTKKRQLVAQARAIAQRAFDAARGRADAAGQRLGDRLVNDLANPSVTGFAGPVGPIGGNPAVTGNALRDLMGGRSGGGNMGGGRNANTGGGVGSGRARAAGDAPGGPRGGPGL